MNDIGPLLLSLCGLGVVCGGVLLVAFFFGQRLLGFGLQGLISAEVNDDDDPLLQPPRRSALFKRNTPAREQRQSLDFDSAVQYYRQKSSSGQTVTPPPTAQSAPGPNPDLYTPPAKDDPFDKYRQRLRRRDNEEDILGLMSADDDEGDGILG